MGVSITITLKFAHIGKYLKAPMVVTHFYVLPLNRHETQITSLECYAAETESTSLDLLHSHVSVMTFSNWMKKLIF